MLGGVPVTTAWEFSGCKWRDSLQLRRVAVNTLNKQQRTNDKG
jgi:hypothetical protein